MKMTSMRESLPFARGELASLLLQTYRLIPETGAYADGSVERKHGSGSGRLGLGATADPNEPSQYDNVYTSYRKQRSTTYHSSMSVRATTR
ncbi:hypothetical protein OIU84_000014 [Salix udensis]|uniref:SUPPRESSOR-OF-WHITE-APRICOT-like C-terminal domain-containing protein n=1 Tax=Salix udensis TaxID=889485 RepID=A0AAD6L5Y7_9ROSI|nr:hypothetical protein OIU84_000014 [Salix udensis]